MSDDEVSLPIILHLADSGISKVLAVHASVPVARHGCQATYYLELFRHRA